MDWLSRGRDGRRFAAHVGTAVVALLVVSFRESLLSLAPLVRPPGGTRWFTLVAVVVLSFVVPLLVAVGLADARYTRRSR
ncbi:hypothetical protein [Halomarina litorea]|uniref:hypothetical protein n=1 Tax=Halomarina litorea TaxID=2961595 RepID=UPI0020C23246|nr:hypothetical protein [Halomarina sp. BCD28]